MRKLTISVTIILLALAGAGCEKKPSVPADKIIARINNYEMTVDDFEGEARLLEGNKYFSKDPAKAKEDLLNELIKKQLLIQEAQRQNFDKDKAFMKEIERYWEQALLKLLIKKKIKELSAGIEGASDEERQQRLGEAFNSWMKDIRQRSGVKVYEKNLEKIEIK